MKIIHVICVFLSLLCSATFKNVVVETTAISFDIENKFGRVRTTESDAKTTQYEYDSRGNLVKEVYYEDDGSIGWLDKYEYDKKNNLISKSEYNSDGNIISGERHKYDSNNNKIELDEVYRNGKSNHTNYTYDSKNRLITKTSSETFLTKDHYVYDSNNNMIESYSIDALDFHDPPKHRNIKRYKYNSKNQTEAYYAFYNYDNEELIYSTLYQYNNNDSLVYEESRDERVNKITRWKKYEYDKKNNLIKETYYNDMFYELESFAMNEYTYDRKDNLTSHKHYKCSSSDCEIIFKKIYKYDSRGGMTQKLDYRYMWEFGEYSERLDYKKQWKHKYQRIKVQ